MKTKSKVIFKFFVMMTIVVALLLCFSGCNRADYAGGIKVPPTPNCNCGYRLEKTHYDLEDEIAVTFFISANQEKKFAHTEDRKADIYIARFENYEERVNILQDDTNFEEYEKKEHVCELTDFYNEIFPKATKAGYATVKRVIVPSSLLTEKNGEIAIVVKVQDRYSSTHATVFYYKIDGNEVELSYSKISDLEENLLGPSFDEHAYVTIGSHKPNAVDISYNLSKKEFSYDEEVEIGLTYKTNLSKNYTKEGLELRGDEDVVPVPNYVKEYKARLDIVSKENCFNFHWDGMPCDFFGISGKVSKRVKIKEIDDFYKENYPYSNTKIDKIIIPKEAFCGEHGEIILQLNSYYWNYSSVYYKQVDGKILLSETRFYS